MSHQSSHQNESSRRIVNPLVMIAYAVSFSVEVFLRKDFGRRYVGLQGFAVLFIVPLYCLLWDWRDARPMNGFLIAYVGMCLVGRLTALRAARSGRLMHTLYSGTPRVMSLLPRLTEVRIKKQVEPCLVFAVALPMAFVAPALSVYLVTAGLCVRAIACEGERQIEQRAMQINDAVIEQQVVAERFREMRGEYQ